MQNDPDPDRYTAYSVTAMVTNSGPMAASNVAVDVPLPPGLVFVGGDEFTASQGTYSPYFGQVWEVGTLAPDQTATLTVRVFLLAPMAPEHYAQVIRSSQPDPDSTPGNGTPPSVNEDDEASTSTAPPATACDLEVTLTRMSCINDNRTPGDASDDYFTAALQVRSPIRADGTPVTLAIAGFGIQFTTVYGATPEVTLPAGILDGGTFTIETIDNGRVECSVAVTGRRPGRCPAGGTGCAFDATFPGVTFSTTDLASQMGSNYVLEGFGERLIIAEDGSRAEVTNTALLRSNGLLYSQIFSPGDSTTVVFGIAGSGAASAVTFSILDARGGTVASFSAPLALVPVLGSAVGIEITDYANFAGQYAVAGTYRMPSSPAIRRPFVIRRSLVTGDNAFTTLDGLVPGTTSLYTGAIRIAGLSQDGDVYLEGRTATAYELARVSPAGRLVWGRSLVAGLNGANRVYDTELSANGSRLYVGSKEGNRLFLRTLRSTTGNELVAPIDLGSRSLNATMNGGAITGTIAGVLPLVNGNVLVAYNTVPVGGTAGQQKAELLWVDGNGTTVNRLNLTPVIGTNLAPNPILETTDGELVFISQTPTGLRVLQLTSDGSTTPNCGPTASNSIDLELSVASASPSPRRYTSNIVTYTITNRGAVTATGVTVSIPRVAGTVLTGGSEFTASKGTYSAYGNRIWTVGSLAPGATATISISYFGLAADGYTAYGQVATANEEDVDSTPGNGVMDMAREDDEAMLAIGTSLRGTGASSEYLRMYPNPAATGQSITFALDIPVESQQGAEIIVSDLAGRVVARRQVSLSGSSTQITLDLAGIPAGVYVAAVPELELEPQRLIITE